MPAPNASPVFDRPTVAGHTPIRPLWHCRHGCGTWPCPTARLLLRAVYDDDPIGLSVQLAGCLFDATGDLLRLHPDTPPTPSELFVRFVGWTRRSIVSAAQGAVGGAEEGRA